jgi:hypothetical protein
MTNQKQTKSKKSLDEFVGEKKALRFVEHEEVRRESRAAAAVAREATERAERLEKELALSRKFDAAKLAPATWLTPTAPSAGHHAIPILDISDVHWGEVVDPAQVQNVNAFNVPIAMQRVHHAFEGAIVLARDYMKGVVYDGIEVVFGGDIVSGNIHDLRETNEETAIESCFGSAEALVSGLTLLAKDFKRVHVTAVVGNHSRSTMKPIFKNRVRDSLDWAVYRMVREKLAGDARVTMLIADAQSERLQVYGVRYAINHGESFRGGSGISAELAPLLLGVHRMMKREAAIGHPFDVLITHHKHRGLPMPGMGIMLNGSIVGYNEMAFDEVLGYQEPEQNFWLNTPEHGIGMIAPVFVQDRASEGW